MNSVNITRTDGSQGAVQVTVTTDSSGSATGGDSCTAGIDFINLNTTASWADGETGIKQPSLHICPDAEMEPDETVTVVLSNPTGGATLGTPSTSVYTILDDDTAGAGTIRFLSAAVSAAEGSVNSVNITRTDGSQGAVQVTVTTDSSGSATGGDSCTAGIDFINLNTTASWADGETGIKQPSLHICPDAEMEPDETVTVVLSNPTGGATLGTPSTSVYTIVDDDRTGELPTLAIDDVSVAEGDAGTTDATFTVSLSAASDDEVTVDFATAAGSATASADFDAASGTLTFAPGETEQTISITVNGDTTFEPDETFFVTLSDAVGATITTSDATGTILNDDPPPNAAPVAIDDTATVVEDSVANAVDVLANDSDPDGDPRRLTAVTAPEHGTATLDDNGTPALADDKIRYTPALDYFGPDAFEYTISDGELEASARVTVTVTPVNDAPVAVGDTATVAEDGVVTVDVAANDSAGPANEADQALTFALATDALHGAVDCTTAGSCTYTPDPNFFGADTFAYAVSDGSLGAFATVHVTVIEVNDPPVAGDDAIVVPESGSLTFEARANDSRGPANEAAQTLAVLAITLAPAHGTAAVLADGRIRYTPTPGFDGADGFSYRVCDNGTTAGAPAALCDEAAVSVDIEGFDEQLEEIIDTSPPSVADKLEDALEKIEKAEAKLAQTPPDRQGALGEYEGAVGELESAVKDGMIPAALGNSLMDRICGSARRVAEDAIAEAVARGGNAGKVVEARRALAQGDTRRAQSRFKDAVSRYKDAVSKAEGA